MAKALIYELRHPMSKTWKIAGINFDHMHMGDLLRMVHEHPNAEIAAICDEHRNAGNRGQLWHWADKIVTTPTAEAKAASWFYKKSAGGGSLLDYLGYGTTLGTWFMNGRKPIEISALTDRPAGLEVDEHAIVIARYATGLSKFETRWGTFTDPWTHQPQPKCGFVIVGSLGTISSFDFEPAVLSVEKGGTVSLIE
jgi:hypothetical protein